MHFDAVVHLLTAVHVLVLEDFSMMTLGFTAAEGVCRRGTMCEHSRRRHVARVVISSTGIPSLE
jgi:hypothetical protein